MRGHVGFGWWVVEGWSWKVGSLGDWKVARLDVSLVGGLETWKVGNLEGRWLEGWKLGELEGCKVGCFVGGPRRMTLRGGRRISGVFMGGRGCTTENFRSV